MNNNCCYTYFRITGNFDPDKITEMLGLHPDKTWKIGDIRPNGTSYDFSNLEFSRCDKYDVLIEKQMHHTIAPFIDKIDLLNNVREKYNASFSLVIVPTIYACNTPPCLSPSRKVIDFCHATGTELDIDLHVMDT